ncbi:hypothetical protein DICPUDRAFT_151253 [Dictyostelium purpureum]|uniref:Right handed beta helix domain-containing protein n=1 Tax=Dictyostelium purpureum TaxID=5786 RepID=F0ZID6_DICPU|nr:uncharacterized protein DICPUDRAFT_151253 [Dictyostelium purpureum]EGC36290.1 hypothetical protein DICPUDRAFT_151253 [Dictyostelium purpureum]|eukprot:XP_003287168.1 hypothetical protein DICPUDRAFT_151253 [Dictyostelium purpureum]
MSVWKAHTSIKQNKNMIALIGSSDDNNNNNINKNFYDIFVSESKGEDTPSCSITIANKTATPCKTIGGAVESFNNNVIKGLDLNETATFPKVNFILYPGQYYGNSIQLYRYNATITAMENQTSPVFFNLNNQNSFFNITPTSDDGNYYISEVTINQITIQCGDGHSQTGSLIQIDGSQRVLVQVTLNQLYLSSNNINESLIVVSGTYGDEDNPSQDWTASVYKDYYNVNPYVIVNLYNSNFSNSIAYSSIVSSSYAPITLRLHSCIFSNFQNINYTFFVTRGVMEVTNLTLINVGVSYKPFFSAHNTLITFTDSNIQSYMASTSFFQFIGCFVYIVNSNISIQYNNFDETIDYAIFYLDVSSGSFLNNNITFFGRNTQLHDQGSINIMSSQVSFRLNTLSSNISSIIFSEASNVFSFLNNVEIQNNSTYYYFQCSSDQQSSISGDTYSIESFNSGDNNCSNFSKKQKRINFIIYFFIGFGSGIGLIAVISIFTLIYKKYSQSRYKRISFDING